MKCHRTGYRRASTRKTPSAIVLQEFVKRRTSSDSYASNHLPPTKFEFDVSCRVKVFCRLLLLLLRNKTVRRWGDSGRLTEFFF